VGGLYETHDAYVPCSTTLLQEMSIRGSQPDQMELIREGDWLSINGTTGEVRGGVQLHWLPDIQHLVSWVVRNTSQHHRFYFLLHLGAGSKLRTRWCHQVMANIIFTKRSDDASSWSQFCTPFMPVLCQVIQGKQPTAEPSATVGMLAEFMRWAECVGKGAVCKGAHEQWYHPRWNLGYQNWQISVW
jgi:hypothetical protein